MCKICPADMTCPTGSINPSIEDQQGSEGSIQPNVYQIRASEVNYYTNMILYGCLGLFCLINIGLLYSKKLQQKMVDLDMYDDQHNFGDNVPMFKTKTKMGG